MSLEIAALLGALLAAAHYFSERFHVEKHRSDALSFTAGVSVAYVFLYLVPEGTAAYSRMLFVALLVGFALFHVIEKHTFRHRSARRRHELREVHTVAFFVYHIIIGMLLVFIATSALRAFLFFVPVLLHSTMSSASLKEIHVSIKGVPAARLALSLSPLIGVLVAAYLPLSGAAYNALLGFIGGALLYIAVRDELPSGRSGRAAYFILGMAAYITMLLAPALAA